MFIDQARIKVHAGRGGAGCLSFRREKYIPRGGPDGGDGGHGGSIYLVGNLDLNTLVDFQYNRLYKAENGQPGAGKLCSGASGKDLHIATPLGTVIVDANTKEVIGELTTAGQSIIVARGGKRGLGNARYKSSVNRSPKKTTPGTSGESRTLDLELRLLADVGLVGMPNSGKSTLIRTVTNARPKTAAYPFTTLTPKLGVVSLDLGRSYTIADIPGLIEGASEGVGLGIQFLKHLRHTRLLFHMVDIVDSNKLDQIAKSIATIERELAQFDKELITRERWLVLNKIDLLQPEEECNVERLVELIDWKGNWFSISALTGKGCRSLVGKAMNWLEENPGSVKLPSDFDIEVI